MFGQNPKRPPIKGDGHTLAVQEIFPTIQGEGPFTGYPSVFIRLGGCNLACSFCDTEFESYSDMTLKDIMAKVEDVMTTPTPALAVITGGEPLRQPLSTLCNALIDAGHAVQIETNGTFFQALNDRVNIVCSPKATKIGGEYSYSPLRPDMLARVNALKFLISATLEPYTDVPDVGQFSKHYDNMTDPSEARSGGGAIAGVSLSSLITYLQPMDEYDVVKNAANLAHTLHLAQTHGYCFSVQLHKIVGIA